MTSDLTAMDPIPKVVSVQGRKRKVGQNEETPAKRTKTESNAFKFMNQAKKRLVSF